jgi:hypothetical protein
MAEAKIEITAVDRATAVFNRVSRAAQNLSSPMEAVGRAGAAVGALFAAGGAVTAVAGWISELDDLADVAQGIGITAESLSTLRTNMALVGVEGQTLDRSLLRLNERMVDAAGGGQESAQLFKTLGINVKNADGSLRGVDAVLGDIADKWKGFADGAGKSAFQAALVGDRSYKMTAALNEGREGLTRFAGASAETIDNARRLQSEIDKLSVSWSRMKMATAGAIAGIINDLIDNGDDSPEALLRRTERAMADVQKQINNPRNEGERLNAWITALEGLQATAERARAAIAKLNGGKPAGDPNKPEAPALPKRSTGDPDSAYKAYLRQLDEQIAKLQELSNVERTVRDLNVGNLKVQTAAQEEVLLGKAAELDAATAVRRELELAARREIEAMARYDAAEKAADDRWQAEIDLVRELTGEAMEDLKRADRGAGALHRVPQGHRPAARQRADRTRGEGHRRHPRGHARR